MNLDPRPRASGPFCSMNCCITAKLRTSSATVDALAAAADVGRMTVFNHFVRKEDMFFDRDEEGREILREALRHRDPSVSPIETLRQLAHRLVAEQAPFVQFSAASQGFVQTV